MPTNYATVSGYIELARTAFAYVTGWAGPAPSCQHRQGRLVARSISCPQRIERLPLFWLIYVERIHCFGHAFARMFQHPADNFHSRSTAGWLPGSTASSP